MGKGGNKAQVLTLSYHTHETYILPLPLVRKTANILLLIVGAIVLASCSAKRNTASSRFWQSFVSHYNIYFNGEQAYIEGEKAKVSGHKDDFTKLLPVFLVGNESSRTAGKSNYETAITKCQKAIALHSIKRRPKVSASKRKSPKMKAYLQRKEYNPFLKNAWLLMGKAQFEKGEFLEAAATFSYITRYYAAQPEVASEARQWLARCYSQVNWFYDAEDALQRMQRDSVLSRTRREADATQADLLLRQERYAEALPYLQRAARQAKGSFRQARLYYLLGQVNQQLGNKQAACKALSKCIRKSPPYELSFNARILQTEVMSDEGSMGKKMISKLKRMARQDRNKDYLDQVYYAMGNIQLAQRDTAAAIASYEMGRKKSVRKGLEKGVLLLRLGEVYWDKRQFDKAQSCYTEAVGLLDKERPDYEEITRRSKVLDKLVPYTSAVYLQDSLQALARMPEAERNAAIDRVIEALRKKEAEERKARRDSAAQARLEENGQSGNTNSSSTSTTTNTTQGNKEWYFYNPMLVAQGKQDFQKRWGKRKNEDNWRRSNHTVIQLDGDEGYDYAAEDSLQAVRDSLEASGKGNEEQTTPDSLASDPHERAYYLAQIPFTEEARQSSDAIIMDGLYNAGVIEKDDLEDFPLAASTLERLTNDYPTYENMADAYYQLFLLYSRWGKTERAEAMKLYMAQHFPDNDQTKIINDPDFEYNARYGKQIEDSLYTATYQAYRQRDINTVDSNFALSSEKYPNGINRPKFIFVHALSRLGTASSKELIEELRGLVQKFPDSDVSPLAGMIVKGLESGRKVGSGTFDLGSLWDRRNASADAASEAAAPNRKFSAESNAPFLFVLAYPTDSVNTNQLLYEMAHFNFTTFVVRGFDMSVVNESGLSQFRVSGFASYNEVHAYAQRIVQDASLRPYLAKGRILLISKQNLELLGTAFSINDYQTFFDRTFAPLQLPANQTVEEAPIEQHYEDEYSPEELEHINSGSSGGGNAEDDGDWY